MTSPVNIPVRIRQTPVELGGVSVRYGKISVGPAREAFLRDLSLRQGGAVSKVDQWFTFRPVQKESGPVS